MKKPKAPAHLKEPTRAWCRNVVREWSLEEHHVRVLTLAAEAYDRATDAQALIARDGWWSRGERAVFVRTPQWGFGAMQKPASRASSVNSISTRRHRATTE